MDSVTQFVLGAAIGEATLREADEPAGGRALTWQAAWIGGVVGTLPDLDVLSRPFLTAPQALASHRGITHSLFFCTLMSPLLAMGLRKLFRSRDLSLRQWTIFVWLTLNTHWMLDTLTTYGTQIFQPFSNYPVNIGSIFIVDPLYTLPLFVGLLISMVQNRRGRPHNLSSIKAALVISTAYLAFTLVSKYTVFYRLKEDWESRGVEYRQMITAATPFNSLVYYAYVDTGTDVWVADGALFDSADRQPVWQRVPKNHDLFPGFGEGVAGETLLWFSRGFYRLESKEGKPVFTDLRFGRLRGWLTKQELSGDDFIFRFYLRPERAQGPYTSWGRRRPGVGFSEFPWDLLWKRMKGQDGEAAL
jgi:inner membrane protein